MKVKKDLIQEVVRKIELPKKVVSLITEQVLDVIKESLNDGEDISIRGFGAFKVIKRAEKQARNIHLGTKITLPEKKVVKFKPYFDVLQD